jgi:acyl-CoA synthetase (AMP-forming)/AMP-acid ligase II
MIRRVGRRGRGIWTADSVLSDAARPGRGGYSGPYWGKQVAAVIIPKPQQDRPFAAELHGLRRENLAAYKAPRFWCFTDAFAATETGKLHKLGRTWQRETI